MTWLLPGLSYYVFLLIDNANLCDPPREMQKLFTNNTTQSHSSKTCAQLEVLEVSIRYGVTSCPVTLSPLWRGIRPGFQLRN